MTPAFPLIFHVLGIRVSLSVAVPPVFVTDVEGGDWREYREPDSLCNEACAYHAAVFPDGSVYDAVNGWRGEQFRISPARLNDIARTALERGRLPAMTEAPTLDHVYANWTDEQSDEAYTNSVGGGLPVPDVSTVYGTLTSSQSLGTAAIPSHNHGLIDHGHTHEHPALANIASQAGMINGPEMASQPVGKSENDRIWDAIVGISR